MSVDQSVDSYHVHGNCIVSAARAREITIIVMHIFAAILQYVWKIKDYSILKRSREWSDLYDWTWASILLFLLWIVNP